MIRINLLADAREKGGVASNVSTRSWLWLYLVVCGLWLSMVSAFYVSIESRLDDFHVANRELRTETQNVQKRVRGFEELKKQVERGRRMSGVIQEINKARSGPLRILMELSKVLSQPGGPTIDPRELEQLRHANPYATYDANWDVRRLWVERYVAVGGECTIVGKSRSNEDVSEFMRRLTLSELYTDVELRSTKQVKLEDGLPVQHYVVGARVGH